MLTNQTTEKGNAAADKHKSGNSKPMNLKYTTALLAISCTAWLAGCSETPRQSVERERTTAVKSETRYGNGGWVYTIEHDKHWFVLEGRYSKGAMLHHPDCPCGKAR